MGKKKIDFDNLTMDEYLAALVLEAEACIKFINDMGGKIVSAECSDEDEYFEAKFNHLEKIIDRLGYCIPEVYEMLEELDERELFIEYDARTKRILAHP